MKLKILKEIVVKNLKIAYIFPSLACVSILIIAAMIFPTAGLTEVVASKPLEMILPFVGVIAMGAIFLPEQDTQVMEAIASRKIGIKTIQFIRLLISIVLIVLYVLAFGIYMMKNECIVTTYMMWGGIASSFFMGSIAFFFSRLTGNVINGIVASFVYYFCNIGMKKQLGVFFLFRMSSGDFSGKYWLAIVGLLLIFFSFIVRKR